jgi:hypothetical protein
MAAEEIMAIIMVTTPIPTAATFPATLLARSAKPPPKPAIMTNTKIPNDPFCLMLSPFHRSMQERPSFTSKLTRPAGAAVFRFPADALFAGSAL